MSLAACDGPRPSDAEIIGRFEAHRAQIDSLMEMLRADRVLTSVDDKRTDPADPTTVGISRERIDEYRRILEAIGFRHGFYYDPQSGRMSFLVWAFGFLSSGQATKAILYMPENPTPLVDDLDAYRPPQGQEYVLAYRHIEGQWYLRLDGDY